MANRNATRNLLAPDAVLSVSQLNRQVRAVLEGGMRPCWVRGEISNLRRQSSGHTYFTLKDADSAVACVLFRAAAARLGVTLADGQQAVFYGQVNVYEPRGQYQLIVQLAVEDGEGRLRRAYEHLREQLASEGLFARERKRALPTVARRLGVITSPSGAAIEDFLEILRRRRWGGTVVLFPARVQGTGAAAELAARLAQANSRGGLDLLVLMRGGGSLEDLWPFNEEALVRAVAASALPVLTGIGHEIDTTLCDHAADVRVETPSGAAELLSSMRLEARERLDSLYEDLHHAAGDRFAGLRADVTLLASRLQAASPRNRLQQAALRADELARRLEAALERARRERHHRLAQARSHLLAQSPEQRLRYARRELATLARRFERAGTAALRRQQDRQGQLARRLENLSLPRALQRGYAIVRNSRGEVVTRKEGLRPGERLSVDFADGEIHVTVEET